MSKKASLYTTLLFCSSLWVTALVGALSFYTYRGTNENSDGISLAAGLSMIGATVVLTAIVISIIIITKKRYLFRKNFYKF